MGYELKMKVGRMANVCNETWFFTDCTINLCKCGESNISKLAEMSMIKKGDAVLSWFVGDEQFREDSYGDKPRPIQLADVIKALRKDVKNLNHDNDRPYRRFEWALSLLESIDKGDDGQEKQFSVIFVGY